MKRLKRFIFSVFGKQVFWIRRKDFWWCEELSMWDHDPWSSSTLAAHNWSNGRYTNSRYKAFKDFEECIDLDIDCTMEHDAILFKKRIALWDYHPYTRRENDQP